MKGLKISGDIKVNSELKDAMNKDVMKLLYLSGMRDVRKDIISDEEIMVVGNPDIDTDGRVYFNYNIFENIVYGDFFYDTKNQSLCNEGSDIGTGEFSFVIHLIETLQEIYSQGTCFFTFNNKLSDILFYFVEILQSVLDKNFNLISRKRIWNMYKFFMLNDKVEKLSLNDVLMSSIAHGVSVDINQLAAIYASNYTLVKNVEENELGDSSGQKSLYSVITSIFKIVTKLHINEEEQLYEYLRRLLDSDLADRKIKSREKGTYGVLAKLSLYVYPAIIVSIYAHIKSVSFWDLWADLKITGYEDIINLYSLPNYIEESADNNRFYFYQAIGKENEDDFLDSWDGYNLNLSYTCSSIINSFKCIYLFSEYDESEAIEDLKKIVQIHTKSSDIRYVNDSFVKDFLENINDVRYRKALYTYKYILNESISYMEDYRALYINTFHSIMSNRTVRKKIFGF